MPPDTPGIRAEGTGCGFKLGVEARQSISHDADDDSHVVKDVGDEDGKKRMKDEG
jgi:hypothetical protein